jgi:hypothetical protein
MPPQLSRRDFLQRASGALAALALPPVPRGPWDLPLPEEDAAARAEASLGRITTSRLNIHAAADVQSEVIGYRTFDDLITLLGTAEGPGQMAHNSVWFKTKGGYAYSSFVQPVARRFNRPLLPSQVSAEQPALVEVTMPYTDTYRQPATADRRFYRLYYATTHWAVGVERDENRQNWYKLHSDRGYGYYYARAEHLRPIPPEELAPLSPGAPDKHIEVDLTEQRLTAYEGEAVVLSARVSTGAMFGDSAEASGDFRTPAGTFRVWRKRASRHMQGGTSGADGYDLPGVPWVSYFTGGIALHGTYWHNDYGRPRSHGCVNLTPEDAHWLYRWTEPEVPAGEEIVEAAGTLIRVLW